jgi:sugar O-acyltransferase (sialic acid O-acetyltransferase NeuD family)
MARKVLIFGTGDVAFLAKFYLLNDSNYSPAGFCVDDDYVKENTIEGLPVIASSELSNFSPDDFDFFVCLYDNKFRSVKSKEIKNKGYSLISYVSSKASVFSKVGENSFIMENNVIQPFVTLGKNIIMWSGNHVGHHSVIEDDVFLSSHVVVSGHCHICSFCWIGVNASIRDHTRLAEGTFVCMSSVITKNTNPYKKYFGSPAKECGLIDN